MMNKNVVSRLLCAGLSVSMMLSMGSVAVSYTHLDVYKRQVQLWRAGTFLGEGL